MVLEQVWHHFPIGNDTWRHLAPNDEINIGSLRRKTINISSLYIALFAVHHREGERENTTGSDFPTSNSAKQVGRKEVAAYGGDRSSREGGVGRRVNEQKGLDKSNGRMLRLDRDNEGPREG